MKTITKKMTNGEIYQLAIALINNLTDNEVYMPAAVAFSIEKNKALFSSIAEDVERARMGILQHYSESNENGEFKIPQENIAPANAELVDLLSIEQEVKIYTFEIEKIEDIKFTSAQMQAIMFMLED